MRKLFLGLLFLTTQVSAATITTDPTHFVNDIVKAQSGDTVKFGPGTYPINYFRGDTARIKPLIIDASDPGAILGGLRFDNSSNITIKGAHVVGHPVPGGPYVDDHLAFNFSYNIKILGVLCDNVSNNCVGIGHSHDILIKDVEVNGSVSDGVDIGASQRVKVTGIGCYNGKPGPLDHPDCVQMYSFKGRNGRTDDLALEDITIEHGQAMGNTQGFDMLGNEITASRIIFRDIHVLGKMPWGSQLDDPCNDCTMDNVTGWPMRGSQFGVVFTRPHQAPVGSNASKFVGNSGDTTN